MQKGQAYARLDLHASAYAIMDFILCIKLIVILL